MTLEVRGAGTPAGTASGTHDDQRARMLTEDALEMYSALFLAPQASALLDTWSRGKGGQACESDLQARRFSR